MLMPDREMGPSFLDTVTLEGEFKIGAPVMPHGVCKVSELPFPTKQGNSLLSIF